MAYVDNVLDACIAGACRRYSDLMKHVPQDLVAPKHTEVANPLLDNHIYQRIGRNLALEVSPAVVHFGGYDLNVVHEQVRGRMGWDGERMKWDGWIVKELNGWIMDDC